MVLGSTLVSILHVCGGDPCAWPVPRWINLVFSTYVEVILESKDFLSNLAGYSPRMWRWSWLSNRQPRHVPVFSTYVEVIPLSHITIVSTPCILHVCGGDPQQGSLLSTSNRVFSTYVEVIPLGPTKTESSVRILHVCGGDPHSWSFYLTHFQYSPRMWRWSSSLRWFFH